MKIPYPVVKILGGAAEKVAVDGGVPMAVALADEEGSPQFFARMDGTLPASSDLAVSKAYTAAALRMPTETLGRLALPGGELYGIQHTHGGRIVLFGGGIPFSWREEVFGAIGVSGGTVAQDIAVGEAAVAVFHEIMTWADELEKNLPRLDTTGSVRDDCVGSLFHSRSRSLQPLRTILAPEMHDLLVGALIMAIRRKNQ